MSFKPLKKDVRSIFFDSNKPISKDKLKELIEIANLSPSSFNLQPWEVIVVVEPERKKVLRSCALNQPKVEEASAVLIMIANPKGVKNNLERVLDSWQKLGYIKPDMRDTYTSMAKTLYAEENSLKRKIFAVKILLFLP